MREGVVMSRWALGGKLKSCCEVGDGRCTVEGMLLEDGMSVL